MILSSKLSSEPSTFDTQHFTDPLLMPAFRILPAPDICLKAQIMFADIHVHLPKAVE